MYIYIKVILYETSRECRDAQWGLQRVPRTPGILSPKFRGCEFPRAPRWTAFRSLCPSYLADSAKLFSFAVDASQSMLIYGD